MAAGVVVLLVGCGTAVAGLRVGARLLGVGDPAARSEGVTQWVLPVTSWVTYSPDGRTLAALGELGTVQLWDVESGTVRQILRYDPGRSTSPPFEVFFAPDGKTVATLPADRRTIQIWDAQTGAAHPPIKAWASDLFYSPDGRTLATTGDYLQLWDLATGALRQQIDLRDTNEQLSMFDAAFAPDGRTIAAVTDRLAGVWDVATGARVHSFVPPDREWFNGTVKFAPDGQTVVTTTHNGAVWGWDTTTGRVKWSTTSKSVHDLAYAPDGSLLAASNEDSVWLIDPLTGTRVRELLGRTDIQLLDGLTNAEGRMVWAPDSRTLAFQHGGGWQNHWARTPRIWDAKTGTALQALTGHTQDVYDMEYAPDGRTLVTVSRDNTARIWQMN